MENPFVSSRSETSLQMIPRPAPVQTNYKNNQINQITPLNPNFFFLKKRNKLGRTGAFFGGVSDESEIDEIGAEWHKGVRIIRAGASDPSG